jgi:hypothetical protein
MKGRMATPYRKWFNRFAVIVWGIYAAGILLLPFCDEAKERHRAFDRDATSYQLCKSATEARAISANQVECDEVYHARRDRDAEAYRFGSDYRALGWHLAWIIPASVLGLPLILYVVLYSLIFGLAKAVTWLGELDPRPTATALPMGSIASSRRLTNGIYKTSALWR